MNDNPYSAATEEKLNSRTKEQHSVGLFMLITILSFFAIYGFVALLQDLGMVYLDTKGNWHFWFD